MIAKSTKVGEKVGKIGWAPLIKTEIEISSFVDQ